VGVIEAAGTSVLGGYPPVLGCAQSQPEGQEATVVSRNYEIISSRTGSVVATEVEDASGAWKSFRGLMLRKELPVGYGMLFRPARGIHTHFMRVPIDVIFLDEQHRVARIRQSMPPWRFDFTSAAAAVEVAAGTVVTADIRIGDQMELRIHEIVP
jgi:uncharacterized membrane protein (UPF0127 family)